MAQVTTCLACARHARTHQVKDIAGHPACTAPQRDSASAAWRRILCEQSGAVDATRVAAGDLRRAVGGRQPAASCRRWSRLHRYPIRPTLGALANKIAAPTMLRAEDVRLGARGCPPSSGLRLHPPPRQSFTTFPKCLEARPAMARARMPGITAPREASSLCQDRAPNTHTHTTHTHTHTHTLARCSRARQQQPTRFTARQRCSSTLAIPSPSFGEPPIPRTARSWAMTNTKSTHMQHRPPPPVACPSPPSPADLLLRRHATAESLPRRRGRAPFCLLGSSSARRHVRTHATS